MTIIFILVPAVVYKPYAHYFHTSVAAVGYEPYAHYFHTSVAALGYKHNAHCIQGWWRWDTNPMPIIFILVPVVGYRP